MIYHLELEVRFCSVQILINGFPIETYNGQNPGVVSIPINGFLIGKKNIVNIIQLHGSGNSKQKPEIKVNIKTYDPEEFTGPEEGILIANITSSNSVVNLEFDNDFYNFSNRFLLAKQIEDDKQLDSYVNKLLNYIINRKTELLFEQSKIKLNDFAIAYGLPPEQLYEQWLEFMSSKFYSNKPILDLTPSMVLKRSWCDKRIWELGIGLNFDSLISTEANEEGRFFHMPVFVGVVKNEFCIIR